jgi:Alpha/beta hydrolase domain
VLAANPNSTFESMRALRRALIDWVVKGTPPPASRYPRLDHGDLVLPQHSAMGFPAIPGAPLPDNMINPFYDYDFGPELHDNDMSGAITRQPPLIRGLIPMLVPRTDSDGNETSGIPSVLHRAPLGTYLGWNTTASGYRKNRACGFIGGFIPFARTKAERLASGDPRLSLEERYGTHAGYVAKVKEAARRLVEQRFLLEDDADRLVREAEASDVLR